MQTKQIGAILLILGVLLAGFVILTKQREDAYIETIIQAQGGSCYLDDGTCLHADRDYKAYILGGGISVALIIFGLYLAFIDKSQEELQKHQVKITSALKEAKETDKKKDEFKAYLAGFTEDEQSILKAVNEQDGIKQSTLRFRTDISKATLSVMLKSLEERDVVKRKPLGKTKQVFLRKKF